MAPESHAHAPPCSLQHAASSAQLQARVAAEGAPVVGAGVGEDEGAAVSRASSAHAHHLS